VFRFMRFVLIVSEKETPLVRKLSFVASSSKRIWISIEPNDINIKELSSTRQRDFYGEQLLAISTDIASPTSSAVVDSILRFRNAYKFHLMPPEIMALVYFSKKFNASFIACPGSYSSLAKGSECRSIGGSNLDYFFSSSDFLNEAQMAEGDLMLVKASRVYMDSPFEITFTGSLKTKFSKHLSNLLVRPTGNLALKITFSLGITLSTLIYLFLRYFTNNTIKRQRISSVGLFIFRSLVSQCVEKPKAFGTNNFRLSLNLLILPWMFSCLILMEIYKGNIFGYIFRPPFQDIPNDFRSLIVSKFKPLSQSQVWKSLDKDKDFKRILISQAYSAQLQPKIEFVKADSLEDLGIIYRRLVKEDTVLLANKESIVMFESIFDLVNGASSYQGSKEVIATNKFWTVTHRLLTRSDVDKVHLSVRTFTSLLECGIFIHIREMFIRGFLFVFVKSYTNLYDQTEFPKVDFGLSLDSGPQSLGWNHVKVFFYCYFLGIVCSFVNFILCICIKLTKKKRENLPRTCFHVKTRKFWYVLSRKRKPAITKCTKV